MKKNTKKFIEWSLFIIIILGFIFIGTRDFSDKIEVDNEKFDHDYTNVSSDNVFTYTTGQEVLTALKSGSAIIFMGYPTNKWSGYYANILNETAKEEGITKILYYDFYEDRKNKSGTYQSIVLKLSSYLATLDSGVQNIYAPTLVIVKNGSIIAYDNETAITTGILNPDEYWNSYQIGLKKNVFKTMFGEYLKDEAAS